MAKVLVIKKVVNGFAIQINWMISLWLEICFQWIKRYLHLKIVPLQAVRWSFFFTFLRTVIFIHSFVIFFFFFSFCQSHCLCTRTMGHLWFAPEQWLSNNTQFWPKCLRCSFCFKLGVSFQNYRCLKKHLISLQFNPISTNNTKWPHHSNNSSAVASELF